MSQRPELFSVSYSAVLKAFPRREKLNSYYNGTESLETFFALCYSDKISM
jgi:hypothetical protein